MFKPSVTGLAATICVTVCLQNVEIPTAEGQIREYRRRFIGDFGYAHVDRRGNPFVVINPRMCRRLGPELCSFFRNHEYAHHHLNHFHRNISVQQAEAEADAWAARMSSPQAVRAASNYFAAGKGGRNPGSHGSSYQRWARLNTAPAGIRYYRRY